MVDNEKQLPLTNRRIVIPQTRHLTALVEKLSERLEDLSLQHDSLKLDNRRNQSAIKALQDAETRRAVAINKSNRSRFPWSNR